MYPLTIVDARAVGVMRMLGPVQAHDIIREALEMYRKLRLSDGS